VSWFSLSLFGGCDNAEVKAIQVLQNRAVQIVHSPPRAERLPMFTKLKWLSVNQLITYHTLLAVFKIRQSGEPKYLAKYLQDDNRTGRIIMPNTKLTLAKSCFVTRDQKIYKNWSFQERCQRMGGQQCALIPNLTFHFLKIQKNYCLG
jgi:hypothetical protein